MVVHNLKPHTTEITKPMFKASIQSISSHLEEEKKKISLCEREKQALHVPEDIKK